MIAYAESSAVLAWLLGEDRGLPVRKALGRAEAVVASHLTVAECERALVRGVATGRLTEAHAADARRQLAVASAHWTSLAVSEPVLDRAGRPFPREPLRTLDAIHLATALAARAALPSLLVISLDERVRDNARDLGFEVHPPAPEHERPGHGPSPAPG